MKKFDGYCRALPWFMALLLSVLLAACGGGGQAPILGAGDVASSSAKAITSYSLAGVAGVVNETAKTIVLTLPNGSNVTALVATFSSTGAGVKVGAVTQVSGSTPNHFSSPVLYTVTAPDGSNASYTVAVAVASSSAKALNSYSLAGVAGTINEAGKRITVILPFGTSLSSQVATFTSSGTGVKVGATTQISGSTANNFSSPVSYTVTAADSSSVTYSVNASVASNSAKALTAYSLAGVAGVISESAKTITATLPFGSNVTAQVASFTSTGASVKVGSTTQTSGSTPNNFSSPVSYTVTASDNSTVNYGVTVQVAPSSAKAITAYALGGVNGTINQTTRTIAVALPSGTSLTALVASFSSTGASVKVGAVTQISAATANNFSAPVTYTVTAADASTVTYSVNASVASAGPAPVSLGAAGNFVILSKSGISTVPNSVITGDIGVSPAATTFLTGFSLTMVGTTSATSTQVTGDLFGADMTPPSNSNLTTSVSAMEAAYTDAATRPAPPDFLNLGSGEIGGQTLAPGLYTWTSGVTISSNVTVSGGPNDVWIFQIPGNLTMSAARNVILAGGAKAKNIFWQVAGFVEIGTNAHFEGIMLSQTAIHLRTGASMNGRALAQTEVTLDQATVTQPAP